MSCYNIENFISEGDDVMSIDLQTAKEQAIWEHYKAIEAKNFQLENQLEKANKENLRLLRIITSWRNRCFEAETKLGLREQKKKGRR